MRLILSLALSCTLITPTAVRAAGGDPTGDGRMGRGTLPASDATLSGPAMPNDVRRVARALAARPATPDPVWLVDHLDVAVRVFGRATALALFTASDVNRLAPAPFGPPTHHEWLTQLTPAAFRSTMSTQPLRPRLGLSLAR